MSKTTKFEFDGTTYQVSTDASDSAILLPNGKVVQGQWSEMMPPRLDGTTVREVPGYEGPVVLAVALNAQTFTREQVLQAVRVAWEPSKSHGNPFITMETILRELGLGDEVVIVGGHVTLRHTT